MRCGASSARHSSSTGRVVGILIATVVDWSGGGWVHLPAGSRSLLKRRAVLGLSYGVVLPRSSRDAGSGESCSSPSSDCGASIPSPETGPLPPVLGGEPGVRDCLMRKPLGPNPLARSSGSTSMIRETPTPGCSRLRRPAPRLRGSPSARSCRWTGRFGTR